MTYPAASANMIVLWDRWFDHLTKKGLNATITATPRLAPNQVGTGTPNLRSAVDQAAIKTGKWTTLPMPSGLWALPLLSNNDQQFGAFGGYDIAAGKEPVATVELLESTPTVPLTQEMFDALTVACTQTPGASPLTLRVGDPVQAVWIGNAAVVSAPAPVPPTAFLDSAQTTSLVATYTWRPRGAWSGATAYDQRDVVRHLGSAWIALAPSQNKTPGGDPVWEQVVAKGDTGATGNTGQTGQTGPPNSLSIGTVTTGAAGSSAAAQITGTAPSQSLSLTVPRGATGSPGNAGPANSLSVGTVTTGAAGSSASAQITGTPPAQSLDLTVPRGATGNTGSPGQTGSPGPANVLAIGTVSTGAAGSSASAQITGTAPAQTLGLTIPRGDKGEKGDPGLKGDPGSGSVSTVDGDPGPNVNLGLAPIARSGSAADLTSGVLADARIPSSITRDSELADAVTAVIAELRGAAPEALNDFLEVATRLQQDQDALASLTNLTATKLAKSQNLADLPDKAAARDALGLAAVARTGVYADLSGRPRLGRIDAADYGWSPESTAAQNDAAIATAITAARAAKLPLWLGVGVFHVSTTINARVSALTMRGAGIDDTVIICDTDSADLIHAGGFLQRFSSFRIRHASDNPQANTGDGLVFFKSAYSTFEQLEVDNARRLITIAQADVADPGTSSGTGNWMFTNTFRDVTVNRFSESGLYLRSYSGRSTGSIWDNTYVQNKAVDGTARTATGNPVDLFLLDDSVFSQLNIEDAQGVATALLHNSGGWVAVNGLHLERCHLGGYMGQYVRAYGGAGLAITALSITGSDIAQSGSSGAMRIASAAAGGRLDVRGVSLNNVQKTRTAARVTAIELDDSDATNSAELTYLIRSSGSIALDAMSDSTTNPGLKRVGDTLYGISNPNAAVTVSTARIRKAGDQAVSAYAPTPITMGTVDIRRGTVMDLATADGVRVTAPGVVTINAEAWLTGGAAGERSIAIKVNGTTVREFGGTAAGRFSGSTTIVVAANALVSLELYSAVAVTVSGSSAKDTGLTVTYLGPAAAAA